MEREHELRDYELTRDDRALYVDVTATVGPCREHHACAEYVSLDKVTCAGCGHAVELTAAETSRVERDVLDAWVRRLEDQQRDNAEDAA